MPKAFVVAVVAGLLVLVSITSALPIAFASSPWPGKYNQSYMAFMDLQKVGGQHNSYASYHKGHCGQESSKGWVGRAKKDVASVKGELKALWKMSPNQRKKKVFRDLVKADKLLKSWGQGQIVLKLNTCKRMPTGNSAIQQALATVYADIGNPNGY